MTSMAMQGEVHRVRTEKVWAREAHSHYVEPFWVGQRLFAEETFEGNICDPCAGFGRMVIAARQAGYHAIGCDLIDRGFDYDGLADFLASHMRADNFVFNPPFELGDMFALKALDLAERKVAMIYPVRRLNAAHWIAGTPLYRIWYLAPRPSMPPGWMAREYERKGRTPSGGKQDFCVLVWLRGYEGEPTVRWLRRDAA